MLAHAGADLVGGDAPVVGCELRMDGVAQGHRLLGLERVERLGELLVAALGVGDARERLPHLGVHARELHLGGALLPGADLAALLGEPVEVGQAQPPPLRGAEARDGEDVEDLGAHPDGRHQAPVAAQLVDPERREHLLHALLQALQHVRGGRDGLGRAVHGLLEHRVGAERLGPEAEGDHHVVHVADAGRLQHEARVAAHRGAVLLDRLAQRLVHGRDGEVGVADPVVGAGGLVVQHDQLRASAHGRPRGLGELIQVGGHAQVAVERERQAHGAPVPRGQHVLHAGHALAHRDAAHVGQRHACTRRGASHPG